MVLSGNAREYSATVVTVIGVTEEQAAAPKFMLRLLGDCHGVVYSCCVAETIARALINEDRRRRQTVLMLGRYIRKREYFQYILDCEYAMGTLGARAAVPLHPSTHKHLAGV